MDGTLLNNSKTLYDYMEGNLKVKIERFEFNLINHLVLRFFAAEKYLFIKLNLNDTVKDLK